MDKRLYQLARRWEVLIVALFSLFWGLMAWVRGEAPMAATWLTRGEGVAQSPVVVSRFADLPTALLLMLAATWLVFRLPRRYYPWMDAVNAGTRRGKGEDIILAGVICGALGAVVAATTGFQGVLVGATFVGAVLVCISLAWAFAGKPDSKVRAKRLLGAFLMIPIGGLVMLPVAILLSGVVAATACSLLAIAVAGGVYAIPTVAVLLATPFSAFGRFFYRHMLELEPEA